MASPCKRLKRDTLKISTPNQSSERPSSPSLSSISNSSEKENAPERKSGTRLSFASENDEMAGPSSSNTSSVIQDGRYLRSETPISTSSNDDYIGEDYDEYFKNLGRIHHKGHAWKLYKPIKENTLYSNILEEPDNVHAFVTEWMYVYKSNPGDAIKSLIQFCVDLAGFTKFNVFHNYSTSTFVDSSKRIIEKLESEEVIEKHDLIMAGKYLLAERNVTLVKTLRMGIYSFLQKLIKLAHIEEVLYDEKFTVFFLDFIKQMQLSKVRCIRHTAVVIGIKVLTAIILVYSDVINDSNFVMNASESTFAGSQAIQLAEQKTMLDCFIECLYFLFIKNCRLQDDRANQMRIECISEAKIWIKYFPKIFISDFQTVHYIMKLIIDPSKDVRMAALCACEDLFNIPQVLQFLKPLLKELTKIIAGRFLDINIYVAKKAIDFFTLFIQIDSDIISRQQFLQLGDMIFEKNAVIGIAASQFFANYFQLATKSPARILLLINELYRQRTGDCIKELLVEGFLYVCECMQDWRTFCKLILSDRFDEDTKTGLAELFSESVYQFLSGKSDVMREMSKRINHVDTKVYENIAELFPMLNGILSDQSNPKILKEILRIIPLVKYMFLEKNYCKEYTNIANTTRVIFNYHTDESLLKNAAQVIFHLCSVQDFATRAEQISETICNENINDLQEFLNNPIKNRYMAVRRVATLYQHFNLNDQITFGQLTEQIKDVDDKSALGLLDCCRWYLIWELKTIIEDVRGEFDQIAVSLQRACSIFFSIAFSLLQNEQQNQTYLLEVYSILCDFCRLFDKELEDSIKLNKRFKMCELKIEKRELQEVLLKFLQKNIICNEDMSLIERRTHVIRYVDLIQIDVIPIENMANIFKYYHVYYEEYGPIIDQCLTLFAETCTDDTTVYYVVIYTLLTVYKDILQKYLVIDLRTEEVSQLKLLSKRFSAFKHFSKTDRNLYTLFYVWMKGAFSDESKLDFLYFIKPFMSLINDSDTHRKIYNNFKNLIPKEFEKHNAVLWLGDIFKHMQVKKVKPPPKLTKKPTAAKQKENVVPKTKRTKKDKKVEQSESSKSSKSKSVTKTSKSKLATSKKIGITGTETEDSSEDDMTIHDSESDDIGESMSSLRIQSKSSVD